MRSKYCRNVIWLPQPTKVSGLTHQRSNVTDSQITFLNSSESTSFERNLIHSHAYAAEGQINVYNLWGGEWCYPVQGLFILMTFCVHFLSVKIHCWAVFSNLYLEVFTIYFNYRNLIFLKKVLWCESSWLKVLLLEKFGTKRFE